MTHDTERPARPWQVPEVEALASLRPSRPALLAGRYTARHLLALALLLPLVLWWYHASLPPGFAPDAAWWAALGVASLLGAAALATYVPAPRAGGRSAGAPCGAMAGVLVVLAALTLGGAVPSVLSALPAVLLAGAALGARVLTASTCR